jgi:hypothetical protein
VKVRTTTNGRELNSAIDGVSTQSGPLAQAFAALARLLDTTTDHEVILRADADDKEVTVSVAIGQPLAPPAAEAPFENPYWAELDREQQANKARTDAEEAERIRAVLEANPVKQS